MSLTTKQSLEQFAANCDAIDETIGRLWAQGIQNIFLVGCGGTYTLAMPWKYFADRMMRLPVFDEMAAELMCKDHRQLGPGSLCLYASASGNTKEIVQAMAYSKQRGAVNIAFLAQQGGPMEEWADYIFYVPADNDFVCFFCAYAQIMTYLSAKEGAFELRSRFMGQLYTIGAALDEAAKEMTAPCIFYAARNAHAPWHMVLSSGACWGEATCYAMCVMEEMQWIRTRPIHAAEFFHGTMELVEKDLPVIMMLGEDGSRPLAQRALDFLRHMTQEVLVFDSQQCCLPVDETFRWILAPAVMMTVTKPLSKAFQTERNHDLAVRRFYRQMEY